MRYLCLPRVWVGIALLATMGASAAPAPPPITWRTTWNAALFTQAAKEHRFVLLTSMRFGATGATSWTTRHTPTQKSSD